MHLYGCMFAAACARQRFADVRFFGPGCNLKRYVYESVILDIDVQGNLTAHTCFHTRVSANAGESINVAVHVAQRPSVEATANASDHLNVHARKLSAAVLNNANVQADGRHARVDVKNVTMKLAAHKRCHSTRGRLLRCKQ